MRQTTSPVEARSWGHGGTAGVRLPIMRNGAKFLAVVSFCIDFLRSTIKECVVSAVETAQGDGAGKMKARLWRTWTLHWTFKRVTNTSFCTFAFTRHFIRMWPCPANHVWSANFTHGIVHPITTISIMLYYTVYVVCYLLLSYVCKVCSFLWIISFQYYSIIVMDIIIHKGN